MRSATGYGLQHVHRKIGRAALHLPVLSDRKVAARSHLLLGQFKRFAQPAQTGRNRLNRVTHCLFVLNERSALRVWIYMIVPVSCMLQIFNYFLVNVFGYEDEVEKLVEEDEDE